MRQKKKKSYLCTLLGRANELGTVCSDISTILSKHSINYTLPNNKGHHLYM